MPNFCIKRNGEILIYDADGAATPLGKIDEKGNYLLPKGAQPHLSSIIEEKIREVVRAELEEFEKGDALSPNALEEKICSLVSKNFSQLWEETRKPTYVFTGSSSLGKAASSDSSSSQLKMNSRFWWGLFSLSKENGINWVDLGLPSRLKWATCNLGASKPEEQGHFFAWGEREQKEVFDCAGYKFGMWEGNNPLKAFTGHKYVTKSCYGYVDDKRHLDPSDDAAEFNWGGKWRMPTLAQFEELVEKCDWQWSERSGVSGYYVKSKTNNAFIFLPAAGSRVGSDIVNAGYVGYYWSRSLDLRCQDSSRYLYFGKDVRGLGSGCRSCGCSVRPVCKSSDTYPRLF